jgi:hypothetical protein
MNAKEEVARGSTKCMARSRLRSDVRPHSSWSVGRLQRGASGTRCHRRSSRGAGCRPHAGRSGLHLRTAALEAHSTPAADSGWIDPTPMVTRPGRGLCLILGCAVLLWTSCRRQPPSRESAPTVQAPESVTNPNPAQTHSSAYPGLDRFSDPLDQLTYKLAYTDCRTLGVQELSRAYEGRPRPPSVRGAEIRGGGQPGQGRCGCPRMPGCSSSTHERMTSYCIRLTFMTALGQPRAPARMAPPSHPG